MQMVNAYSSLKLPLYIIFQVSHRFHGPTCDDHFVISNRGALPVDGLS